MVKDGNNQGVVAPARGVDASYRPAHEEETAAKWSFVAFSRRLGAQLSSSIGSSLKPSTKPVWINPKDPERQLLDGILPLWTFIWFISRVISILNFVWSFLSVLLLYIPSVLIVNTLSFFAYLFSETKKISIVYLIITELVFAASFWSNKGIPFRAKVRLMLSRYFTPIVLETVISRWRIEMLRTPAPSRGLWWQLKAKVLLYHSRVCYFLHLLNPPKYFKQLNESANIPSDQELLPYDDRHRDYFPFGGGVAVASGASVKQTLLVDDVIRHKAALEWELSPVGAGYSKYNPTFLSSQDDNRIKAKIFIQKLMEVINNRAELICGVNGSKKTAGGAYLDRFLLPNKHFQISEVDLARSVGELKYFLVTGGQFTSSEAATYEFLNSSSYLIYPGMRASRELAAYNTLREALWRRLPYDTELWESMINSGMKEVDALRLLTVVFSVFLAFTTKLCISVVNRLYLDPLNGTREYEQNKLGYILESARLSMDVPMVSYVSSNKKQIQINNYVIELAEGTPLHLITVSANREFNYFHHPDLFVSTRGNLTRSDGVLLTFDAIKFATCCDQSKFALTVAKYIVDRFKPTDTYRSMRLSMSPHTDSFYSSCLDGYTLVMMKLTGSLSQNYPRAIEMYVPTVSVAEKLLTLVHGPTVPLEDEDNAGDTLAKWLIREIINSPVFGVNDLDTQWNTVDEARVWRHQHFGAGLPLPTTNYDELESDEKMSRLAFFAMPCYYTRKTTDDEKAKFGLNFEYVNDASHVGDTDISTIPVRGIYDRYGAMAFFDKDFVITGIYWCGAKKVVLPTDNSAEWAHAKWVWKSSWFMLMTVNDHLMVTHLIEANAFAKATSLKLPINHPLRPFLKPFTYQTVTVNRKAVVSLVNEKGFVHRLWAFAFKEFVKACKLMYNTYTFRKMPEFIHPSMREMDDKYFPINQDAREYWDVIHNYVDSFFKLHPRILETAPEFVAQLREDLKIKIVDEAELIDVITQLIVNGTAKHELVGQVSDYTWSPQFVGCKLQPNMEICNVQTYTQLMALTLLTGFRMPMLKDDWSHLFTVDSDLHAYEEFRADLYRYELRVNARNAQRKYPFLFFDPQQLECSVSI